MYVRYGNYTTALDETALATSKRLIIQGGIVTGVEEDWRLRGFKIAATQAALLDAITILEIAFGRNQQTIQLLLNNGTTVARQMPGVHPLGGTEVIEGVSFPVDGTGNNGAEFVNHRTWEATVRGRYSLTLPQPGQLISWNESLTFWGGGPRRRFRENLYGRPRGQTLVRQTIYHAQQSGSAVGLLGYPTPPLRRDGGGALWPHALVEAPRLVYHAPKRSGSGGSPTYTEFQVDWQAEYESDVPLLGTPTYWR